LHAMQALSQLSYGPTWRRGTLPDTIRLVKKPVTNAPNSIGIGTGSQAAGPPGFCNRDSDTDLRQAAV
jgi:hypothetical protein